MSPAATLRRLAVATPLAALTSLAAACGGGADAGTRPSVNAMAAPAPLFDGRGQPRLTPPALVPADTAARTRSGLYATHEQLAWEERVAAPCTVVIDVDAVGSPGSALQLAEQVRYWRDTRGLSFFVRSRDPVTTARTADALSDAGFAPVFAVHGH